MKRKLGNRGKISYDEDSRLEFDILRESFKTENKAARFARQFSYAVEQWKHPIAPLGAYQIGMTAEFLKFCQSRNIQYKVDPELVKYICPKLYISEVQECPNPNYHFRDYQRTMVETLCKAGRGVILSPTRSGKSLILARTLS